MRMQGLVPEAYRPYADTVLAAFAGPAAVTTAADVAEAVWRVATDPGAPLRTPAGPDAVALVRAA